jgi:integrase
VILPRCGGVRLDRLTVGRCARILQKILEEESISKARHARAVLSLVCGYAVRDDAMPSNPVRDVQRLPTTAKKESTLNTEQLSGIRELMQDWRITRADGPRPNYRILIDGMEIMLGTSIRIGECLALRRCDVDMTTRPHRRDPVLRALVSSRWSWSPCRNDGRLGPPSCRVTVR